MKGSRILFFVSWVLLSVLALAFFSASVLSTRNAYGSGQEHFASVSTQQIRSLPDGDQAVKALKGRRLTAATFAMAYSILMGFVILVPYRQGQRWAWWALLVSMGLPELLSLARIPVIGTNSGESVAAILLAFTLLGLLAGAPRMFMPKLEEL